MYGAVNRSDGIMNDGQLVSFLLPYSPFRAAFFIFWVLAMLKVPKGQIQPMSTWESLCVGILNSLWPSTPLKSKKSKKRLYMDYNGTIK